MAVLGEGPDGPGLDDMREELLDRGITNMPVCSIVTQVEVDPADPAFENPTKPIGKFMTEAEAKAYQESTAGR